MPQRVFIGVGLGRTQRCWHASRTRGARSVWSRHVTTMTCSSGVGRNPERQPRKENVAGSFYVDHTCIDCDTCRWMSPGVFGRVGNMSAVVKQPEGPEERQEALRALLSCPTFSIHVQQRDPGELAAARDSLPQLVQGCENVFHCGFHDENSYGATPYLIRRPAQPASTPARPSSASASQPGSSGSSSSGGSASGGTQQQLSQAGSGGNILVDVPRWSPALAKRIEQLGGIRWIFLTHRDDVGDHEAWAKHFGAERIIHRLEANSRQGTDAAEWQLEGEGPWALGDDVELIFTPGHTAGCVSLLFKPDRAMLTGDHLAYSQRLGRLTIFRAYNWHSVPQQLDSVSKLAGRDFLHVLPGHGRRTSFRDASHREQELAGLLEAEGWRPQGRVAAGARL